MYYQKSAIDNFFSVNLFKKVKGNKRKYFIASYSTFISLNCCITIFQTREHLGLKQSASPKDKHLKKVRKKVCVSLKNELSLSLILLTNNSQTKVVLSTHCSIWVIAKAIIV